MRSGDQATGLECMRKPTHRAPDREEDEPSVVAKTKLARRSCKRHVEHGGLADTGNRRSGRGSTYS
jgi:hypothetical protein